MMAMTIFRRLAHNVRGSMTIETAIVAPVLIMMTLGIFEAGTVIARQHELQSAANESEIIAIATNQGAEANLDQVKAILRTSLALAENDVALTRSFRCGTKDALVLTIDACGEDEVVSTYLNIDIQETYTPKWTAFGIGSPIEFSVQRRVQVS